MNSAKNTDEPTFLQGFGTRLWKNGVSIAGAAVVAVGMIFAVPAAGSEEMPETRLGTGAGPSQAGLSLGFAGRAVQGAATSVGAQASQDAIARAAYNEGKRLLEGAPRGDPVAAATRTALKIEARAVSSMTGGAIAEIMRPIAEEAARVGGMASKGNAAVDAAIVVAGKAGPTILVVGAGVSAYNIATSDNPSRTLAQEGGAWAGGLAVGSAGGSLGAQGGAAVGDWFSGVGAVPGAVIGGAVGAISGGIIGAFGGEKLATAVYDWLF